MEKYNNGQRVNSLDGFRVIAILLIAFSHLYYLNEYPYGYIWNDFFNNATIGTDFFFVLSGFGLFIGDIPKEVNGINKNIIFAINKIKKVYSFYFIMLVVSMPYSIITDMEDASIYKACIKAIIKFAGCLTLCQSAFGSSYLSHALIGTSWFLSTLFLCYIMCPFVKKVLSNIHHRYNNILLLQVVIITCILSCFFRFLEAYFRHKGIIYVNDLAYGSPYSRIWYLIIGMIIGKIYKENSRKFYNFKIELITVVSTVLWYFIRPNISWREGFKQIIDIAVVIAIMFALLYGKSLFFRLCNSKLSRFSPYVMYIFLCHLPLIWYVNLIWNYIKLDNVFGNVSGILQLFIIVIVQIIVLKIVKYGKERNE